MGLGTCFRSVIKTAKPRGQAGLGEAGWPNCKVSLFFLRWLLQLPVTLKGRGAIHSREGCPVPAPASSLDPAKPTQAPASPLPPGRPPGSPRTSRKPPCSDSHTGQGQHPQLVHKSALKSLCSIRKLEDFLKAPQPQSEHRVGAASCSPHEFGSPAVMAGWGSGESGGGSSPHSGPASWRASGKSEGTSAHAHVLRIRDSRIRD